MLHVFIVKSGFCCSVLRAIIQGESISLWSTHNQNTCGSGGLQGLINAAVFGFNKLVINEWKHLFNGASFQSGVPLHTDSTMRHVLLTEDDDYDVEKSTGVGQPDDDNMDNKAIAGGSYNTPVIATTEDHRLG